MNAAEHFRAAERLLSEASFTRSERDFQPVTRDGGDMPSDVHSALIARSKAHAALALAAGVLDDAESTAPEDEDESTYVQFGQPWHDEMIDEGGA